MKQTVLSSPNSTQPSRVGPSRKLPEKVLHRLTAAARQAVAANSRGECFEALSLAEEALSSMSLAEDVALAAPLRQQAALALARAGATAEAGEVLRELLVTKAPDGETLGLLGSVSKRLSENAGHAIEARLHLQNARDFYHAGFLHHSDPYCGVNAAALSVLLGEVEAARRLASEVSHQPPTGEAYWDVVTRAEALLILGEAEKAVHAYREAVALAGAHRADLAATRKQCRQLCARLYDDASLLDAVFGRWAVAMIAGAPAPEANCAVLTGGCREWLQECGAVCLWLSGEADPAWGLAARESGVDVSVVLPSDRRGFPATRRAGREWSALLEEARSVVELGDEACLGGCDDRFLLQCLTTSAASRAAVLDAELSALAVAGPGVTQIVEFWHRFGVRVDVLETNGVVAEAAPAARRRAVLSVQPPGAGDTAAREFRALAREVLNRNL